MSGEITLTSQGLQKLKEELEYLRREKRVVVSERIRVAKEFGDLSENAEYHEAKEEQAFVEGRIVEIEHIIHMAHVTEKKNTSDVGIGTQVVLVHEHKKSHFEIVGSTESDPAHGKISIDSPLGQALLGKKKGAIVKLITPTRSIQYKIEELH